MKKKKKDIVCLCVRTFRVTELQTTKSKLFNDDVDARKYAACIYRSKKGELHCKEKKKRESIETSCFTM
jgi:hypothetical protein